jgi:hypothetical protein
VIVIRLYFDDSVVNDTIMPGGASVMEAGLPLLACLMFLTHPAVSWSSYGLIFALEHLSPKTSRSE